MPLLSSAALSKFCYNELKLKVFVAKRKVLIMDKRMDINFEGKKKKKMVRYKGMTNLLQATDVKNFAGSRYVEPSIYEKDHVFLFESDDSSEYQATEYATCPGRRANVSQKLVSPSAEHNIVTSLLKKWQKENQKKAESVVCDKSTQTINFSENISDLPKTPGCQTLPPKDSTALKYVRMRRCPSPKLKAQQPPPPEDSTALKYVHRRRCPSPKLKAQQPPPPEDCTVLKYVHRRRCPSPKLKAQQPPPPEDCTVLKYVHRRRCPSPKRKAQQPPPPEDCTVLKYVHRRRCPSPKLKAQQPPPPEDCTVLKYVHRRRCPSPKRKAQQSRYVKRRLPSTQKKGNFLSIPVAERTCQVEPLVEDIIGVYRPDVIDKMSMKEISDLKKAQYGGRSGNLPVVKYCAKKLNFKPRFHSTPKSPSEFKPNEVVPFVTRHYGPSHVLHGKQFLEESETKEEELLMENEGNVKNEESFEITLV